MDSISAIATRLTEAGIADARREARFLIMSLTSIDPLLSDDWVAHGDIIALAVDKRASRIPLSKITGIREFYGRDFITTEDVLDPRPDSEILIETALKNCSDTARILDLGTGSGCLILTMLAEKRDATGVAVDLSPKALAVARQNAEKLGVADRVEFIEGDFATVQPGRPFDLLISNPPYIPSHEIETLEPEVKNHDPWLALDGGEDGCDPYHVILQRMRDYLTQDSHFILEFSPDICEKVFRLAIEAGHKDVKIINDMAGRERVLTGRCG